MRVHIIVDDDVVRRIDSLAGERGRTAWIVNTITERLDTEERKAALLSGLGCISDTGHEWDDDVAGWVRAQRRSDPRRVG